MSAQIEDHTFEAIDAKDAAIRKALEMIGLQAQSYAQEELSKPKKHADGTTRPNVDTGRLRNSMTHRLADKSTVVVGTNVTYAPYVEKGTSRARPYPFLKPAVNEHLNEYKRMITVCLQDA